MKTLIKLYGERAIENVIGPEMFQAEHVIYLCPAEIAQNQNAKQIISNFLKKRKCRGAVSFVETSLFRTERILRQLRSVAAQYPDCVLDVTGGSDAALVAAGMFCAESQIPMFTYSRRKNRFYEISNAAFADDVLCTLQYSVEDFVSMTGGTMRKGRVDSSALRSYQSRIEAFFSVFLNYRHIWNDQITFFQRISQQPKDAPLTLSVSGKLVQKGERGGLVRANLEFLQSLEEIGFLENLNWNSDEEKVMFRFADERIRTWLRDVGSVLELYMFKSCVDAGIFQDVICSAVVDWDGTIGHGSVSNEIDVVASRGTVPLFISCKACEIKTEALNELSILADRFGGKGAKAVIATTEPCGAAARHRAAQLGIAVIDLEELSAGDAPERLKVIMKVKDTL